jgi:fucose 4-O-acetylase-like acetyltransferase
MAAQIANVAREEADGPGSDAAVATAEAPAPRSTDRLLFIDNIRWTMIVLVVTIHAAVTYSGIGSWYYKEPARLGQGTLLFFAVYQSHLQAFFMGLLFLVAGYFVPASFDRKGPGRFMADRAWRLGIPTLIYALLIQPVMVYALLGSDATSSAGPLRAYARYLLTLDFVSGTGPLWFALALLIFCGIYTIARLLGIALRRATPALPTHVGVAGLILVMAAGSFIVRIVQPIGTSILNMQLCFFTQYVLLFGIGIIARRGDWLRQLPRRFAMTWFALALSVGPILWFATIVLGTRLGAADSKVNALAGGLHWQSAAYSLWESFFCVGVCLGLLVLFREYLNHQGLLARLLSRGAFTVYVIHAPILLGISLAMRSWQFPPFDKFVLLSAFALIASFLVADVLLRIRNMARPSQRFQV